MSTPILIIDPGHGGSDPGAVGNGLQEKNLTLQISNYQYARFQALGVPVAITRSTDVTLTSNQRTKLVRDSGATYCISNHINAGGGEGVEAIHSIFTDNSFATLLAQAVAGAGQIFRRVYSRAGSDGRDYYYMHRETGDVETVILEYGFIDNAADARKLTQNWESYAEAVVRAFCGHIGKAYTPPGTTDSLQPCNVRLVQNGMGFVAGGVSYLPVRAVAEACGAVVGWDPNAKKVTVNGVEVQARFEQGIAYTPARELAQILGLEVEWDGSSKTVTVTGSL